MAMIGNPPIILLDEPSTGMDPQAKRFMWTVISKMSTLRKKSTVVLTTHSMEEAEALCTKMGIMVNGRFRCYGSSQDIKDKFGTGYEVEIKITWPTEIEAQELGKSYELDMDSRIELDSLETSLRSMRMDSLIDTPQYEDLEFDVDRDGSISMVALCQWALLENSGLQVYEALDKNASGCKVLEHYNNFFKFRIERGNKSIGFFFGFVEKLRRRINFEEYGVSQTTLEQIFNSFASEQNLDDEGKKRRLTVRKSTVSKKN